MASFFKRSGGPAKVSTREDIREFDGRLQRLIVLFAIPVAILMWRLWILQVRDYDQYSELANDIVIVDVEIEPDRGLIYDTRGRVVAENWPSYSVYITPMVFGRLYTDDEEELVEIESQLELLTRILNLPEDRVEYVETLLADEEHRAEIRVSRHISRDQLGVLLTNRNELPGVFVVESQRRHYPFDALSAHLLGYMSEITGDELDEWGAYGYHRGTTLDEPGSSGRTSPFCAARPDSSVLCRTCAATCNPRRSLSSCWATIVASIRCPAAICI